MGNNLVYIPKLEITTSFYNAFVLLFYQNGYYFLDDSRNIHLQIGHKFGQYNRSNRLIILTQLQNVFNTFIKDS